MLLPSATKAHDPHDPFGIDGIASLDTFRELSGNIQGTFRGHSVNVQGTFRERSGDKQKA
jgi:hypothetical protein